LTRFLIVDDHSIVRSGIKRLLAAIPGTELLEAETGEQALALVCQTSLQLLLLDLNLPGLGGLELLRRVLQANSQLPVLVFSMHAEPIYVSRALQAGARGYVSKNAAPDELLKAIQVVLSGRSYVETEIAQEIGNMEAPGDSYLRPLTKRELEIMRLLAQGHSLAQIADALGIAYKTVANTCGNIKEKLGVTRTADLIRISINRGLAYPQPSDQ
jgi:two-component system invasion response regulator UvrY